MVFTDKESIMEIQVTEEFKDIVKNSFNADFISAVISSPREKGDIVKIKVRPIKKKDEILFQFEEFKNNQAFHKNMDAEAAAAYLESQMSKFKQMQMETLQMRYQVMVSKKGKMTIQKKRQAGEVKAADMSHNRSKRYILEEGTKVPFLQDLGVMTQNGDIVKSKFDKFRQINRFLEFIEDILPQLPKGREITILDFGCGKSYLTFAMYYYLHELQKYDIRIIGLDLKTEVIKHCNQLAEKYGYEKLKFLEGNIADYTGADEVDMVVTLHACNTATDFALAKAIGWKAKVILSVPCCQHELNEQMENEILAPIFSYGLIKERMAALFTDALRAEYLKREGYDTQILEFIDMEHTPKNILIRAVYTGKKANNEEAIRKCEEMLHVQPTLGELLKKKN